MDLKKHFQELVNSNRYNFQEFLTLYPTLKAAEQEELLKYLFGPGRDSKYIPKLETQNEINSFINVLLTKELHPSSQKIKEKLERQVKYIVPGIKSHTGRLINPSTSLSFLKVEKQSTDLYFDSDKITQRKYGYAGNAAYQGDRLFLEGAFYNNGELITMIDLIIEHHPLLTNYTYYSIYVDIFNEIENEIQNFINETDIVNDELPQTFFFLENIEEEYVSLTVLPSFAMINQMKSSMSEIRNKSFNNKDIDTFNLTTSIKVGGTKPQNVAAFNSDNSGVYQLFTNTTPNFFTSNKEKLLESFLYKTSLFNTKKIDIKINEKIDTFNYANRQSYLNSIIDYFIDFKMRNIKLVIENDNSHEFIEKFKNSKINNIEKSYILNPKNNTEYFDYFYPLIETSFRDLFSGMELSKTLTEYKNLLKLNLGAKL